MSRISIGSIKASAVVARGTGFSISGAQVGGFRTWQTGALSPAALPTWQPERVYATEIAPREKQDSGSASGPVGKQRQRAAKVAATSVCPQQGGLE